MARTIHGRRAQFTVGAFRALRLAVALLFIVALVGGPGAAPIRSDPAVAVANPEFNLPTNDRWLPGRLLVKLADGVGLSPIGDSLQASGTIQTTPLGFGGWHVVEFDPVIDVATMAGQISSIEGVIATEPDFLAWVGFRPNDPRFNEPAGIFPNGFQWNLHQIEAEEAWELSNGAGVIVAVLDTGLRLGGSDQPVNLVAGRNVVPGAPDPNNWDDDNGHGSHVTGTIAQATNNGVSGAGLAYEATIMPVKVCSAAGGCPTSAQVAGLFWARDNGARVANMSLSGPVTQAVVDAVTEVLNDGLIVVAAMGSSGTSFPWYPASVPGVIAVGAIRVDGTRPVYSSFGPHIWIAAPGGDTLKDQNGDGVPDGVIQQVPGFGCGVPAQSFVDCAYQGTSMAAPHVTATVALMLSRNGGLSVTDVREILAATARDVDDPGYDIGYGYGILQSCSAVQAAIARIPAPAG